MSQRSPLNKRNTEQSSEENQRSGMARKSAASAKPARAAASTVRVVSVKKDKDGFTTTKNMTKDERKAFKRAEREEEDQVEAITNMVVKNNELYKKNRRVWWIIMGAGIALVLFTFAANYINIDLNEGSNPINTAWGMVSMVTLVLAYVLIFGSLAWEWTKVRPIRNETRDQVASMSKKRRAAVVEQCQAEEEAHKAKKDKKAK